MDPTYTIKEVARIIQVHQETVRRWIRSGYLNAFKIDSRPQGRYRITRQELERVMKEGGPRG